MLSNVVDTMLIDLGISTNLLILLTLAHGFIPRARQHTRKFFELCYYNPDTGKYGRGFDDVYMFLYWLVIFTGLRAGVMDFILIPFAEWAGLKRKKTQIRFAEQAWQFLYYLVFWTLGMVCSRTGHRSHRSTDDI